MSNKQNDDFLDRMNDLKDLIEKDIERLDDRRTKVIKQMKVSKETGGVGTELVNSALNLLLDENENAKFYLKTYLDYFKLED